MLRQWYQKHEKALAISLASLLLSTFLMNLEFNFLESALYDARMRLGPQPETSSEIVLVALDDYSTSKLDEFSPLPLDQHVRFLELIEGYRPKAVGYLVDLARSAQSFPESLQSDWSSRLISSASRLEATGAPFLLGTRFDVNGEVVPPYPLSLLPHAIAMIHKDGNVFGEDKVTRRALVNLYGRNSFHLDLARKLGLSDQLKSLRGQFAEPGFDADYVFFRYFGNTQYYPNQPSKNAYPVYSFIDVLDGKVAAAELAGKIILVGTIARDDSNDFTYTPYSKKQGTNPKLIVHANVLNSIMQDRGLVEAPGWFHFLITTALISFVIWSVFTYTPLYGVINTVTLALGFLLVGQILFMARGLWIREAQPLIGIFLSYYLTVPYRLIQEYKQRWDYQRRNDILLQVEEMKTNFIRLVTHDLKTPVARIQGLAEMVLRKGGKRLEADENENLKHIVESTDELNHFISSILELTKVESNRVTLNLESKDVNQLVEKSVERLRLKAQEKQIEVELELEPLFPIRIDTSLIAKVLNNLIDNALKYSPDGSRVHIQTLDEGEFIRISVSDQGIGLSEEEQAHLFTRFYRAKNDLTTQISGTGLGLYLTKYFVEAHDGRVEVESSIGKGSKFTIWISSNLQPQPGLFTASDTLANNKRSDSL